MLDRQYGHSHWFVPNPCAAATLLKQGWSQFADTSLIIAARRGQKAMCNQLLAAGANKGLRNKTRATAGEVASAGRARKTQVLA